MSNEYLTDNCIHVCGMNRSGQHAVSNWLLACFEHGLYKNNVGFHVSSKTPTPLFRIDHNPPKASWRYKYFRQGIGVGNGIKYLNPTHTELRNAIIYGSEMVSPEEFINGYDSVYLKNEESLIQRLKKKYPEYSDLKGIGKKNTIIFVLRSPWNNIASGLHWRKPYHLINNPKFFSSRWTNTAKEFLGESNFIPNNFVPIIYDKWLSDIDYRKSICETIGVSFSDKGLSRMSSYGGGSTFYEQGVNKTLSTLKRWQICFKTPNKKGKMDKILTTNPDLIPCATKIFGPPPFKIKEN